MSRIEKYKLLRGDQKELEKAIEEVQRLTGKSRREMIGDANLAGEGLLGYVFDFLGFNDGIEDYEG